MAQNKVMRSEFRISILELPELAIEIILERLTPADLCMMSCVCKPMRERCCSDHLWEKHMKRKWGKVIGTAAHRDWLKYTKPSTYPKTGQQLHNLLLRSRIGSSYLSAANSGFQPKFAAVMYDSKYVLKSYLMYYIEFLVNCITSISFIQEQRYDLSYFDATISYDPLTNSFRARYTSDGEPEEGITWDRIRVPQTDNLPHNFHISNCQNDLQPGDHVEVQWRISKRNPYGWWYGIVAHLESCQGNEKQCCCSSGDRVAIEFKQYSLQSRWRKATIPKKNRKGFRVRRGGFYGGIRKLYNEADISMWKKLWPNEVLP